jgi:hypothetical protein
VPDTFAAGKVVGVELDCGFEKPIAEVVGQVVVEFEVLPGV